MLSNVNNNCLQRLAKGAVDAIAAIAFSSPVISRLLLFVF